MPGLRIFGYLADGGGDLIHRLPPGHAFFQLPGCVMAHNFRAQALGYVHLGFHLVDFSAPPPMKSAPTV